MRPIAIALVLTVACAACRAPEDQSSRARAGGGDSEGPKVPKPQGSAPLLSTNQVLQVAEDIARKRKFPLSSYMCEALIFQERLVEQGAPNRWMVHFVRNPPTPDSDFFVFVEDESGKAKLWHP